MNVTFSLIDYSLLKAKEQESETKKAINRVMANNVSKGKMEEKLKVWLLYVKVKVQGQVNGI